MLYVPLAHGTGIDDIALMILIIGVGLFFLRRSEKMARERADSGDADLASPSEKPVAADGDRTPDVDSDRDSTE